MEKGEIVAVIDFFPQFADVDVDEVGAGIEGVVPHLAEEFGAGADVADVLKQDFEQAEFARAEFDAATGALGGALGNVEGEIGQAEKDRTGLAAATGDGADAGDDLGHGKRFGEVVIGSGIESADALVDIAPGGEQEDGGGVAHVAELADGGESVAAGEHDVHDDGVVGLGADALNGFVSAGEQVGVPSCFFESVTDGVGGAGIVFHGKDVHGVGRLGNLNRMDDFWTSETGKAGRGQL